jgi:Zn-dependent metalloprotease
MWADSINGVAIRSMKDPGTAYNDPVIGKDPQPGHWSNYVETEDDEGGVHINSGIPNRAFYLAAIALGGNAWEKAGKIWYVTLKDSLKPDSQFKDAADATISVAGNLFGADGVEQNAVRNAWNAVGYPFS